MNSSNPNNPIIINYEPVRAKIELMIRNKIVAEKLVHTGKLLDSIHVIDNRNGTFDVEGEAYFKFLDEKHRLTKDTLESDTLNTFIEDYIYTQINEQIEINL